MAVDHHVGFSYLQYILNCYKSNADEKIETFDSNIMKVIDNLEIRHGRVPSHSILIYVYLAYTIVIQIVRNSTCNRMDVIWQFKNSRWRLASILKFGIFSIQILKTPLIFNFLLYLVCNCELAVSCWPYAHCPLPRYLVVAVLCGYRIVI